jgi:hypothetical protein
VLFAQRRFRSCCESDRGKIGRGMSDPNDCQNLNAIAAVLWLEKLFENGVVADRVRPVSSDRLSRFIICNNQLFPHRLEVVFISTQKRSEMQNQAEYHKSLLTFEFDLFCKDFEAGAREFKQKREIKLRWPKPAWARLAFWHRVLVSPPRDDDGENGLIDVAAV